MRTRKNVDIKEYSHGGKFIPNILLALAQTPILQKEQSLIQQQTKEQSPVPQQPTRVAAPTQPAPAPVRSDCSFVMKGLRLWWW